MKRSLLDTATDFLILSVIPLSYYCAGLVIFEVASAFEFCDNFRRRYKSVLGK